MRSRATKENNYFALFSEGKTLRFAIDPSKPITPLIHPEIEDVSLGTKCFAGCPYCYTSAISSGVLYTDVVEKIKKSYGSLPEDQRPFQIAIGGGGEPTLHPEFVEVLKAVAELGVLPNYTTNGMHLTEEILEVTKEFCGGVAVSCHPHLEKIWREALRKFTSKGIKTCLHIIVGEPGSSEKFWEIYDSTDDIYCYVCLPYQAVGRAKKIETEKEWDVFFSEAIDRKVEDIAVGAPFFEYLQKHQEIVDQMGIGIYEPEMFSGYRKLDENFETVLISSYNPTPKGTQ